MITMIEEIEILRDEFKAIEFDTGCLVAWECVQFELGRPLFILPDETGTGSRYRVRKTKTIQIIHFAVDNGGRVMWAIVYLDAIYITSLCE